MCREEILSGMVTTQSTTASAIMLCLPVHCALACCVHATDGFIFFRSCVGAIINGDDVYMYALAAEHSETPLGSFSPILSLSVLAERCPCLV